MPNLRKCPILNAFRASAPIQRAKTQDFTATVGDEYRELADNAVLHAAQNPQYLQIASGALAKPSRLQPRISPPAKSLPLCGGFISSDSNVYEVIPWPPGNSPIRLSFSL